MINEFDDLALQTVAQALGISADAIKSVDWFGSCGCYSSWTRDDELGIVVTLEDNSTKRLTWTMPDTLRAMAGYEKAREQLNEQCYYGGIG